MYVKEIGTYCNMTDTFINPVLWLENINIDEF